MFMSTMRFVQVLCLATTICVMRPAAAAELDYPELVVSPRASERVKMEANEEYRRQWINFAPIQFSAVMTLAAGITHVEKTDNLAPGKGDSRSKVVGIGVGAAWLAATAALQAFYRPYTSAQADLANVAARTPREQLVRERLAEEALDSAATMGRRLTWFSAATNLGTAIYMLSNNEKSHIGQPMAAVAIAASLTPLVFKTNWQKVASDQEQYKKKIYGPISSIDAQPAVFADASGAMTPGFALTLGF